MTTEFDESVKTLTACNQVLKAMVASAGAKILDMFPDKKALHSDTDLQLAIIAEQAEKLSTLQPGASLFGLDIHPDDHPALIKIFLDDLVQFTTLHRIDLGIEIMSWGQMRIAENALFHLAVSTLLPSTYESIDQVGGRVFDTYSIPFKIRLALELKLRTIIGFEKYETMLDGERTFSTEDLPFPALLKALRSIDCLDLPCSIVNIKNVYQWACNFCHTGEKEFVWLTMKALEIISPLYTYEEQKKSEVEISKLWSTEEMSEEDLCKRLIQHSGPTRPLYYFREGWTVERLQDVLNENESKKVAKLKKGVKKKVCKYYLSETHLAEIAPYYCSRTRQHY